jgi:hypothetical protein
MAVRKDELEMLKRPIFIVGTMRSGSTLFRLILDAHPDIAIGEETGFMAALAATKEIPHWPHGHGWFERIGWTEPEFDERLRDFYGGLFERHALTQGKQRWGEKTPFHSRHIPQMATIFPDAVFAGIVRHPGAVVHSLQRKWHYKFDDAVTHWVATNEEIFQRGSELLGERFALLRYEDLVASPEPLLREVVDWLGEPWSDDLLRHNDVHAARGTPRASAGGTRTRVAIRFDLADRWIESFQESELEFLTGRTAELAALFGYDPSQPGTCGPLPAGNGSRRWLLTGDVLASRQRGPGGPVRDGACEPDITMTPMNSAELAERVQQLESTLSVLRSSRAVRWSASIRHARRRVADLPVGLRAAAGQVLRRPLDGGARPTSRSIGD